MSPNDCKVVPGGTVPTVAAELTGKNAVLVTGAADTAVALLGRELPSGSGVP